MVNVGIAGLGMMGVTHYGAWQAANNARVAAVCTRDEKKLAGDWSNVRGNLGDIATTADLSNVAKYRDLDDMLADDALDLIDVCLPTAMHRDVAVAALEAGRHVLVEKPLADNLEDADRMIAAAKASGRMLMVAHVVRFFPQFAFIKSLVDSGKYGKLTGLHLKRVIAMPDWSSAAASLKTKGGPLIDLHIHDVDFLLFLLGRPKRLFAAGREIDGMITYSATTYDYGDGLVASCTSGIASTSGRKFQHHFEAYFERAAVTHARATEPKDVDPAKHQSGSQALTIYHADGTAEFPDMGKTDGFAPQLAHAAACIEAGKASDIIDARFGREALAVVFEEAKSIRSGQVVELS